MTKKKQVVLDEPEFIQMEYTASLIKCLNFYGEFASNDVKLGWLSDYYVGCGLSPIQVNKYSEDMVTRCATLARISFRGYSLEDNHKKYLLDCYDVFNRKTKKDSTPTERIKEPQKKKTVAKDSVVCETIAYVDSALDQIANTGKKAVSAKSSISGRSFTREDVEFIVNKYESFRGQIQSAFDETDDFYVEAYSNLSKKTLSLMTSYIDDVVSLIMSREKTRKPRKKREKTPDQLVKSVRFLVEDRRFGITSIHPSNIIGSSVVVLFVPKIRKLYWYQATEGSTLSIKGTSIVGFDESVSGAKVVRNPDEIFGPLVGADSMSRRQFFSVYESIRSVVAKCSGRISSDTIIFKVY